jgi:hypothetical protein
MTLGRRLGEAEIRSIAEVGAGWWLGIADGVDGQITTLFYPPDAVGVILQWPLGGNRDSSSLPCIRGIGKIHRWTPVRKVSQYVNRRCANQFGAIGTGDRQRC